MTQQALIRRSLATLGMTALTKRPVEGARARCARPCPLHQNAQTLVIPSAARDLLQQPTNQSTLPNNQLNRQMIAKSLRIVIAGRRPSKPDGSIVIPFDQFRVGYDFTGTDLKWVFWTIGNDGFWNQELVRQWDLVSIHMRAGWTAREFIHQVKEQVVFCIQYFLSDIRTQQIFCHGPEILWLFNIDLNSNLCNEKSNEIYTHMKKSYDQQKSLLLRRDR